MAEDQSGGRGAGGVPRRLVLKTLATSSLLLEPACGSDGSLGEADFGAHSAGLAHPVESPIVLENREIGTTEYLIKRPALAHEVEGYGSQASVIAGDTLHVFVNVQRAQAVRCDVYRIGHYRGLGARLVKAGLSAHVKPQPPPRVESSTGLLECAWQPAFAIEISPELVTGYYLCKLTNADGLESYVPFVLREHARIAELLVQASVTTWQAYNRWGGVSLYANELPDSANFTGPRGYRVSFDRPYAPDADIGSTEYGLVRFLEERGYDVAYVTNFDVDLEPSLLENRKLFVTCGHDEYWSVAERNTIQAARDAGLSVAFLSGNTAYRRIRYDSSTAGVPRRVMTCYKSNALDPQPNAPDTTADFGEAPFPRPENELIGVLWAGWGHLTGFPLLVADPSHWLYEGLTLARGDSLGQVLGYEWDVTSGNSVAPPNLETVCDSPALHEYAMLQRATSTVYYPTPQSFVFGAGTISWCDGLGTAGIANPRLQHVTSNILRRAGIFPKLEGRPAPLADNDPIASTKAWVVAGSSSGEAGNKDGHVSIARFNAPSGVAAGRNGELYVSDTGNAAIRRISAAGVVETVAGVHVHGSPRLDAPGGIAVAPDGTVYFSDSRSHQIYALTPNGQIKVVAGSSQGIGDDANPRKARFNVPRGIAVDASGAVYVADFRNDAIRRIDSSGVTTVIAGVGGPTAIAIAEDGTLYSLGTWDADVVRITPDGKKTVLANPSQTYGDVSGPGVSARLRPADGLCLAHEGVVFTDTGNNRVRAVSFDHVNTVGTWLGGSGADIRLSLPRGVTPYGRGYAVADCANHRIVAFEI